MRLLNIETFEVEEFYDPPKYAILSHTWDREMTLRAWQSSSRRRREAYRKAACAAQQATRDGLDYIWIDTICIDKTSSAELSEAINSMFSWYEAAEVCYAYLSDVVFEGATDCEGLIRRSRWFTRGWTLQELIAPSKLIFYSSNWKRIGTRDRMGLLLSQITGIKSHYLMPERHRLSWVSNRVTTRPEDIAYCLLGLFCINMPLLYGERGNAWIRLQKELIAVSDDESIFAWVSVPRLEVLMNDGRGSTMLAPDPVNFHGFEDQLCLSSARKLPYSMTNAGLFMKLPLIQCCAAALSLS
ncbi:HET-domain-containing protein [Xylaria acuta]|nr:HET-domain-containing protein [Xylaria acuta]